MKNEVYIDGERQKAFIRPQYSPSVLSVWNLAPDGHTINELGPHFELFLSKEIFISLFASAGDDFPKSPPSIGGQVSNNHGLEALHKGTIFKYIKQASFIIQHTPRSIQATITGSTMSTTEYKNRTPEERHLLTAINFEIYFEVAQDELSYFIPEPAVRAEYLAALSTASGG